MSEILAQIDDAARARRRLFISTVNLNFLVASQKEAIFRKSLMVSDLCTADGAPIVWISRLLGVPIGSRVAGSDIFDTMRTTERNPPFKVILFGGEHGVAGAAASRINASSKGLSCVGAIYPGFGSLDEMSSEEILNIVNNSEADFISVSLGALKGQQWLLRNDTRLKIPVRAHLGATINFQAGTVARAPLSFQRLGMEWLWRIKEEPALWRRYVADGANLARLLIFRVFPLVFLDCWDRFTKRRSGTVRVTSSRDGDVQAIDLIGPLVADNIDDWGPELVRAVNSELNLRINCAKLTAIDPRFLGFMVVLNKLLSARQQTATLVNVRRGLRRRLRLHGFESFITQ